MLGLRYLFCHLPFIAVFTQNVCGTVGLMAFYGVPLRNYILTHLLDKNSFLC